MRRGRRQLRRKLKLHRAHADCRCWLLVAGASQTTVLAGSPTDSSNKSSHKETSRLPPAYYRPQLGRLGLSTCPSVASQVAGSRQTGPFQWQGFVVLWFVVERKKSRASAVVTELHGIRLLLAINLRALLVLPSRNGHRVTERLSRSRLVASSDYDFLGKTPAVQSTVHASPVISLHGVACHDIRTLCHCEPMWNNNANDPRHTGHTGLGV